MGQKFENGNFTQVDLLACLPRLRAYARLLTRSGDLAEDLVQDTVERALDASHRFQPGTNLMAWMYTILRNLHVSGLRKSRLRNHLSLDAGTYEPSVPASQMARLEFNDFNHALSQISPVGRRALMLVGANGESYEEAAKTCGCPAGTIKSRVSRARAELHRILDDELPRMPGFELTLPSLDMALTEIPPAPNSRPAAH